MIICLVLLALLVAVACGHKNDGGSYSAKKADKLSFKESLIEKIHSFKEKIQAKISSKKAKVHAKKALKHGNWGAQPAADCSTVLDEVWEEHCGTKYEPVCRMEMQPHCTAIQAKECAPEAQTRCSFVFEDKCKTISVPKCTIDWEKRCTSTPDCTTIEAKACTEVEKDVCVTHMDKTCTMSTLNVCRKVAVRELTPVVDTVERIGLKASIKAKVAAHKAQKKGKLAEKAHGIFKRQASNDPWEDQEDPDTGKACHGTYFTCDYPEAVCHPLYKRCDKKIDCRDETDEVNSWCNYYDDGPGNMGNSTEIEPEFVNPTETKEPENNNGTKEQDHVDGPENDDAIKEDENMGNDHSTKQETQISEELWDCEDGKQKIPKRYRCNDYPDCSDKSDEGNCSTPASTPEFFTCRVGPAKIPQDPKSPNQIPIEKLCDHKEDCVDHSDEDQISCPLGKTPEEKRDEDCFVAIRGKLPCISDDLDFINKLEVEKKAAWSKLNRNWDRMTSKGREYVIDLKASKEYNEEENLCIFLVRAKQECKADEVSQHYYYKAKFKEARELHRFHFDGYVAAQEFKNGRVQTVHRQTRSLKGDIAGDQPDFKGRLETFKAGFKAAKAKYHDAKAQFKASTKALIHAKFNKGPKGDKGAKGLKGHHLKAAVPSIRIRYEKSCQDEPRKICTQTPRQDCHKEVVPLCKSEPRETCVPKEKCKSWPKKNCGMVHKETCLPFPTKKCTEISTPVCRIVPRQECTEKKHEICETVPIKDCQKVLVSKPRTVCIPRPTTRTIEDW